MQVVKKIQVAADSLTPSEQRLIKAVVESPRQAALGTASNLARDAGVHEATVSRLVRKLGFHKFSQFKLALQEDFIPKMETAARLEKTIGAVSQSSPLAHLISEEIEALNALGLHISPGMISKSAISLMKAKRILVFGRGNSEALAVMMLRRLRRFGKDVQQLSGDPRDLAEQALSLSEGDIILAFAFGRTPKGYKPLLECAKGAGAATIAISDSSGSMLVPQPDTLLAAPRTGRINTFQTLNVPMTICNAIILAAAATEKTTSLKTLDRLGELIETFENEVFARPAPTNSANGRKKS